MFAAKSTCHVEGRLVTSNHFSPAPLSPPYPPTARAASPGPPSAAVALHARAQPALPSEGDGVFKRHVSHTFNETLSEEGRRGAAAATYLHCVHPLLVGPGIACRETQEVISRRQTTGSASTSTDRLLSSLFNWVKLRPAGQMRQIK